MTRTLVLSIGVSSGIVAALLLSTVAANATEQEGRAVSQPARSAERGPASREGEKPAGDAEKKEPAIDPSLGILEGVVRLKGTPPELPPLEIPKNHQDYAHCSKHVKNERLILGPEKTIANVVVAISSKYRPPKRPAPREVVIDNKNCMFVPHVQAATVGSTLVLKNSDPFVHNTHGLLLPPLSGINQAIPPNGEVKVRQKFRRPGWGLVICDFHTWMQAHVYIFPHEHFAVTKEDGKFRIVNIPPGEYEIEIAHEMLAPAIRPVKKKVKIEAGKTTRLDVELEAPKS